MERGSSPLSILLMNINAVFLTATFIITDFLPFSSGKKTYFTYFLVNFCNEFGILYQNFICTVFNYVEHVVIAELSMNIKQINSTNFNGTTKFLSCNSDGKRKRIAEYLYGSSSFGDTRGLTDLVQRWTYPYAYVEETIGKYHNDKTFKVYIADPNEIVKQ